MSVSFGIKYTVISNDRQYDEYCDLLESLVDLSMVRYSKELEDEIELLGLLIETYDRQRWPMAAVEPVELIRIMMKEHQLRSKDLADILGVSKSLVSSILHYRRALSKRNIRTLAGHFKLSEEVLSRPYALKD